MIEDTFDSFDKGYVSSSASSSSTEYNKGEAGSSMSDFELEEDMDHMEEDGGDRVISATETFSEGSYKSVRNKLVNL